MAEFDTGTTEAQLCGTANPRGVWVDPGTAAALADQAGTSRCPYATAQQAVDVAVSGGTIFILPGASAGDVDLVGKSLNFIGLGSSVDGLLAELGAVTDTGDDEAATATDISFRNLLLSSVSDDGAAIIMDGCHVEAGPIVSGTFEATETTFVFGDTSISASGGNVAFRDCSFDVTGEVTPTVDQSAFADFDNVSARNFQNAGWVLADVSVASTPRDLEPNLFYGDGSDGTLSAGFGTLTLTRDMYYANVAFTTGDSIRPSQFRIYVSGLLDLRGAPAAAIDLSFDSSITGIDGSGSTAGTAPAITSVGTVTQGSSGGNGGAGGNATAAGTGGGSGGNATFGTIGGFGATGGKGGDGTGGGAGKGAAAGAYAQSGVDIRNPRDGRPLARGYTVTYRATETGSGGGGGGGGATGKGGGGGAGPRGSSAGEIFARCVARDSTTNAAAIQGTGPRGGNGGNGTTDGGGGGGGGAGGGSPLLLVLDWLIGDAKACIVLTGGAGGNGGNGAGAAAGGTGGTGATSGRFTFGQRIRNLWQLVDRVTGNSGNGPTGSTGGTGGTGGVLSVTL